MRDREGTRPITLAVEERIREGLFRGSLSHFADAGSPEGGRGRQGGGSRVHRVSRFPGESAATTRDDEGVRYAHGKSGAGVATDDQREPP